MMRSPAPHPVALSKSEAPQKPCRAAPSRAFCGKTLFLYSDSAEIREYIWANGVNVAVVENGALYFVRTDHIGRPVFATDNTGGVVWEASYLPFGGVETSSGPNSDLRFPGQWFQAETGLHQNWMRDYDPTLGRYLQADPLGLVDGASVYGYALQNPGRYSDFMGLSAGVPSSQPGELEQLWCADGEDCYELWEKALDNCRENFKSGYISNLPGCKERANDILTACHGGRPIPEEWGPKDEGVPDPGEDPNAPGRPWWKNVPPVPPFIIPDGPGAPGGGELFPSPPPIFTSFQ